MYEAEKGHIVTVSLPHAKMSWLLQVLILSLWTQAVSITTPLLPLSTDSTTGGNSATAPVPLIEVDCNAVSYYTIMNATSIVRFNNCSQQILVYFGVCGEDAERPLRIEVVGGITVPIFRLTGSCGVWGSVLGNMSFLIRGVMMLYNDGERAHAAGSVFSSEDFGNPLQQTLLAFSGVTSMQLVVRDSRLTFVCSFCTELLFNSIVETTNVIVDVTNSSLLAWSNAPSLMFVGSVGVNYNVSVNFLDSTLMCVVQYQNQLATASFGIVQIRSSLSLIVVTVQRCNVHWDATRIVFSSVTAVLLTLGSIQESRVLIGDTNFSVRVSRSFQATSFSLCGSIFGLTVQLHDCTFDVTLNMTDETLTSVGSAIVQPGIYLIGVGGNVLTINVDILVLGVRLMLVVDVRSLSNPLPTLMAVATVGAHSIVAISNSSINNATISIVAITCSIEEIGSLSIAPFVSTAQFGFSFATATCSLVLSFGGGSQHVKLMVVSSSLTVTRRLDSDNLIFASSSVLSGIFARTTAAITMFSTLKDSSVSIFNTTVATNSVAYSTSGTVAVWNTVGVLCQATMRNFIAGDAGAALSLLSSLIGDAVFINDSTIVIANSTTTMQSSSLADQAQASVILSTAFRLSVVLAALSNLKNTTVTVMNSSVSSSGADSLSPMLRSSECAALIFVIPSSTWSSVIVTSQNTSVTFPTPSFLCASFEATLESVHHNIIGVSLRGNSASEVGGDIFRLAPLSSKFSTTLQLRNVSVRITQSTMSGVRSVLGNLTTAKASTHQTSNNVALAISPVTVSMPSCSSNRWDGEALTCTDMLRPVDGQRAVDWSLARISVDDAEDSWCARCPGMTPSLTLPNRATTRSHASLLPPQATHMTTTGAALTTAALAFAMLTSSSGAASVLPRLQGMVGTLKLASRCAAQSADLDEGSADDSGSSNYAANDISENPFLLQLPSTDPSLAYAAGALVGNTVLVVAVAVVSHLAHRWERWAQRELRDAGWPDTVSGSKQKKAQQQHNRRLFSAVMGMACCRVLPTTPLPASLMQLQGLLLQPVIAAAVVCIASSDRGVLSVMLAVVIGSAWIAIPCAFMWLLCVKYSPLPLITIYSRRTNAQRMRWRRGGEALEWLCAEREEWVAARGDRAAKAEARHVKLRLSAVFAGYRGGRHWYFGVDALQSVLTGAIVGAAESVDAAGACSAVVWGTACVGAIGAVTAVLCIVLRPHVVRFELLAAVVVSLLAVLAAVLILDDNVNGAAIASLVAAAAELLPLAARLVWNACLRSRELDDTTEPVPVSGGVNSSSFSPLSLQHAVDGSCDPTTAAREQRAFPKAYSNRVARVLPPKQEEALISLLESICRTERLNPFLLSE